METQTSPKTCENCGKEVGKLETLGSWNGHAVCGDCYRKLNDPAGKMNLNRILKYIAGGIAAVSVVGGVGCWMLGDSERGAGFFILAFIMGALFGLLHARKLIRD